MQTSASLKGPGWLLSNETFLQTVRRLRMGQQPSELGRFPAAVLTEKVVLIAVQIIRLYMTHPTSSQTT